MGMRTIPLFLLFLSLLAPGVSASQTLLPCTAGAQCPARYYWEMSPTTRTPPTTAPVSGTVGSGVNLAGTYGVVVSVCPESGQTLTGTGTLRAMVWDFSAGTASGWMWSPEADVAVSKATTVSNPCLTFGDRQVAYRGARALLYSPDSVGVSGGSSVAVRINAQVSP